MKPVPLRALLAQIHHHRRPVLVVIGALMLGAGMMAFGVSTTLPDAARWPARQVVEAVDAPLMISVPTTSTPDFLVHQSQTTRRDDSLQSLLQRLGVENRDAQDFLLRDATARLLLADTSGKLASVTHQAMWFQEPGKAGEFVSLDGTSRRRAFLASPLAFSRVTSSYGPRIHPVFGVQKDHKGTDYGAPAGTPVRTVADGVVTFAGRQSGYGNYVVIRHPDNAATAYAHLERISVRVGQRVKQGQNIGAVGATGTATGPNLHFEYLVKGQRTNPTRIVGAPSVNAPVLAQLPSFQREAKVMREQLGAATSVSMASAQ
ncbi:MAG: Murein DD-endopeptidase MepM [Pseudomonadota bacterium]|jgi:murein DD-endopeptidase MepM/ murein hydrolase activator NlpD